MYKTLLSILLSLLTLTSWSQDNTWERTNDVDPATANADVRYLEGAVPVNAKGEVSFTVTLTAEGLSREEIFARILEQLEQMTHEKNQLERTAILRADSTTGDIMAYYEEWLVFKNTSFATDRTRLYYVILVHAADGRADVEMTRISYLYEEERDPQFMKAEEWITDQHALNKAKTKLLRMSARFRRKTIDRKDYIFSRLEKAMH